MIIFYRILTGFKNYFLIKLLLANSKKIKFRKIKQIKQLIILQL